MANLCYNTLHAAGPMERVDEFRILNGQNILPLGINSAMYPWRKMSVAPDLFPARALMGSRLRTDISFHSVAPVITGLTEQTNAWGTKWDITSEVWDPDTSLDKSLLNLLFNETMTRCHSVCFDSPGGPPEYWFDKLGARFPGIDIVLGYEERSNGIAGYLHWQDGAHYDSDMGHEAEGVPHTQARIAARQGMPKKTKPGKLLAAIINDDPVAMQANLKSLDPDGLINGMWTPMMYAARFGSLRVFDALIENDNSLAWQAPSGVGVVDILLDIYPSQQEALVRARLTMLEKVFASDNDLASRPLASGVTPVEMAVRFEIPAVLESVCRHGGLESIGARGGWLKTAAICATPTLIDSLHPFVPESGRQSFFDAIAIQGAIKNNAELLRAAIEAYPSLSHEAQAILRGEADLPNGMPTDPSIVSAYHALMAAKAISRVLSQSASPSP